MLSLITFSTECLGRAVMTLTGDDFPQILIRLERDAYACKVSLQDWWKLMRILQMSHPDMKGHHIVMVVGVNLVCPIEPHISRFWGKTEGLCPTYSLLLQSKVFLHPGHVLFPRLHLLFNHESDCWSDQHYEAFVQSVKPNFPGDSWGYLR